MNVLRELISVQTAPSVSTPMAPTSVMEQVRTGLHEVTIVRESRGADVVTLQVE